MDEPNTRLDVLVVGTFGGGGVHQYIDKQTALLEGRVDIRQYDMTTPSDGAGTVWFLGAVVAALRAAVAFPFRRRPDVVHVHTSHRFSFYRASFYVLFASWAWRRPVVLHVHGSSFDEFVRTDSTAVRLLQRAVFSTANPVIVLSEYWADVVDPVVDREKVEIFPNAVEPARYEPCFGGHPAHIVFVSNLVERKGVEELIEALERLPERVSAAFTVSVAGSGPYASAVEELAGSRPEVEYLGYVSEKRKRALLSEGSVFVLPTRAEGLPIAILEAMAGGNAVVSSTVGSIPEVVGDAGGELFEPGDVAALTEALVSMVENPAVVERMGQRNRRHVERRYDWETVADGLVDLYESQARSESQRSPPARQTAG